MARLFGRAASPAVIVRLLVGIVCAAIFSMYTWLTWTSFETTGREAARQTTNLAALLSQQHGDLVKAADAAVLGLQFLVEERGTQRSVRGFLSRMASMRIATMPELFSITIVDRRGAWIITTASGMKRSTNFRDRAYFRFHATHPSRAVHVGGPIFGKVDRSTMLVPISRRFDRPDGTFGGVILATVRLDYLESLYRAIDVGQGGTISLILADGTVIARKPFDRTIIGRNVVTGPLFQHLKTSSSGYFTAVSPLDGITRRTAYRLFENLPLITVVSAPSDVIYAAWRGASLAALTGVIALLAAVLLLARVLLNEIRSRESAQAQLARYAFLDGLTELANRRHFDAALEREWRRALRDQSSLALLMIDADFFKSYNDRYGHHMGDDVLKRIAACIVSSLDRPTDIGARYGGEEFAVLLPGTTSSGARIVAEKIRAALTAMNIPHAGNVHGVASVSVGVAAVHPSLLDGQGAIVRAADRALYDAKHNGRNRVEISVESALEAVPAGG